LGEEPITVRALAPLPPLNQITFLRKESRAYATGRGPFPAVYRAWIGSLLFLVAAGFAITAIGVFMVFSYPTVFLGRPLPEKDNWLRLQGLPLLVLAVIDVGLGFYHRKMAERENRLAAEGGLLPGELLSTKIRASKGGNYLQVECRFTNAEGRQVTGKKNGRPDRGLKSPPAAGSQVLVLYDTDRLWQVL
jgi:hypothetical protein